MSIAEYETVRFEQANGIARITLSRPDSLNAINLQCAKDLFAIANRIGSDRSVRVAVLTGSGERGFCAGGDLSGSSDDTSTSALRLKELVAYAHMAVSKFAWIDPPLIAVVNGVAAGAGLSLVAGADIAIAVDHARFKSAYTAIGLSPDLGSTFYLSRLLGTRRAMELYLTNRTLSAAEALDWNLVNQVASPSALDDTVEKLVEQLASGPTRAFGGVKRLMMTAHSSELEAQLEREARQIFELSTSADSIEGALAFSQRRQPKFTGR